MYSVLSTRNLLTILLKNWENYRFSKTQAILVPSGSQISHPNWFIKKYLSFLRKLQEQHDFTGVTLSPANLVE